jgi:4-amino-4-deoxy-L-arabinose transferase-like glycosyltransferase
MTTQAIVRTVAVSRAPAPAIHGVRSLSRLEAFAERQWLCYLYIAGLCGSLFFYGLNAGELWRTENLRALGAREMLQSGNWLVPTLYGQPLLTKPPLMYVAIAALSAAAGGVSEWTARLPSAVVAAITVLLVFSYFGRQLGRLGGLVAASILPASVLWLDKATAAEIDMMLVAWVTAAILCGLRALEASETHGACWRWWLAALFCVAGGFLTKWTAPAFFYGTLLPLLWWRGRLGLLLRRHHLCGAALALGVCLAWIGAVVATVGWEVFFQTVSREALARVIPGDYGRSYPWRETLLHPLRILAANLPWSVFLLPAFRPGFFRLWDDRGRFLLQALHCWVWPNLVFWSFISEHATRHSFPLFPGIAGLAALVWLAWLTGKLPWKLRIIQPATVLLGYMVIWLGVKVVFVEVIAPARNAIRQPQTKGAQLAAVVPEGEALYVVGLRDKDEGILFYYGRPVARVGFPGAPPLPQGRWYCLLDEPEWQQGRLKRRATLVLRLPDELGSALYLMDVSEEDQNARQE